MFFSEIEDNQLIRRCMADVEVMYENFKLSPLLCFEMYQLKPQGTFGMAFDVVFKMRLVCRAGYHMKI